MRKSLSFAIIVVLLLITSTCSANLLNLNQWKLLTKVPVTFGFNETYYDIKNVSYDYNRHWVEFWYCSYFHDCRDNNGIPKKDSYMFTRAIVDYPNFSFTFKQFVTANEQGKIIRDSGELTVPFASLTLNPPDKNICYMIARILKPPKW